MAVEGWVLWGQPGPQRPCLVGKALGVCVRGSAGLAGVWEGEASRARVQGGCTPCRRREGRQAPPCPGGAVRLPLMGSTPVPIRGC